MSRILLIEPDNILGKMYKSAISEDNHEVLWAKNGEKALAYLDTGRVDTIVMELLLGQNNGMEFLYEIRSYSDLRAVPVIIHSDLDPSLVRGSPSYKLLHIHAYLYKPDTKQQALRETINGTASSVPTKAT